MSTRRIAIVLDQKPAPASYDVALLDKLLAQAGLNVAGCHLTYLAPMPGLKGDALQAEVTRLTSELAAYAPHFVLILDRFGQVMRAFSGEKRSIKEWRGYVWRASAIAPGVKCMGLWHPATVLKDMGLSGEWRFCSTRAAAEARTDVLAVPTRHVEWNLPKDEIVARLRAWRASATPLACDIEGGTGSGPACHGFADSAGHALVVPIYGVDGASWWSEDDEQKLTAELAALWEDPLVPKIIQNASYEVFVLAWSLGIVVRGLRDDTMLKHAELYAEMDKSLEFQAMLYTRQPFWKLHHRYVKAEGRYLPFHGSDPHAPRATSEEWFVYNGTDCCVTYEVNEVMDKQLKAGQRSHYEWNVRCLAPITYASLRRWRYDKPLAASRQAECQQRLYELQDQINQEAATSGERAELQAFYAACGDRGYTPDSDLPEDTARLADNAEQGALSMQRGLLPLLTTAFCSARRIEKREVEEVTWQPMRHNGERWVRAGKRATKRPEGQEVTNAEGEQVISGPQETVWKPIRNLLTKSVGVPITTLADVRRFTLPSKQAGCKRALQLVTAFTPEHGAPTPAQRGELATLLGIHLKLNAAGRDKDIEQDDGQHRQGDERDANWFVYRHCGAPPQYAKEGGHLTNRLTSDNAALIASWVATQDPRLRVFMEWRSLDTRLTALEATTDGDGRMGCSYILPGTETMRLACRKSATGTGYNLQTVTEDLRDMFLADEGCYIGQLDLRGADGWGVAAECAQLGDSTMLLDLQAGIKPANIIALIYEHGPSINKLSREELLVRQKSVAKDSWIYIASKKVLYGGCYLMSPPGMSKTLLKDSYKETGVPVFVRPKKCKEIQEQALFLRYPGIKRWHESAGRRMMADGRIVTSLGWSRSFFGRKSDMGKPNRQTLGEWLGTVPQFYTTTAIKLAMMRLWDDSTNRHEDCSLRVELLHTVHDSLNPQWQVAEHDYARGKLVEWFQNPITIAGTALTIPASGTYGLSWGDQKATL